MSDQNQSSIRTLYPEFLSLLAKRRDDIRGFSIQSRWDLARAGANPDYNFERAMSFLKLDYDAEVQDDHKYKLFQVREAIERMRKGVYGFCKICLKQLSLEELRVSPEKTECTNCAGCSSPSTVQRESQEQN